MSTRVEPISKCRTGRIHGWLKLAFVRLGVLPFLLLIAVVVFALMSGISSPSTTCSTSRASRPI